MSTKPGRAAGPVHCHWYRNVFSSGVEKSKARRNKKRWSRRRSPYHDRQYHSGSEGPARRTTIGGRSVLDLSAEPGLSLSKVSEAYHELVERVTAAQNLSSSRVPVPTDMRAKAAALAR